MILHFMAKHFVQNVKLFQAILKLKLSQLPFPLQTKHFKLGIFDSY